ncbi:MAG TPA: SAM-dependent DNA methyltransferase, partial [Candidatus Thermoplasmatota archaeon]|nr:SAM-dependent DNA methyltransferase [Candidatus Thermoplasmatota archaeon]
PLDGGVSTQDEPRLGEVFRVKRGIATGANDFFILTTEEAQAKGIPQEFLRPILVSPRFMEGATEVTPGDGLTRWLFSCSLPQEQVQERYPQVWRFLQEGIERGVPDGYLCKNRRYWYEQEARDPPLFFATYMGRGESERPFRFILNQAGAVATNSYLMVYAKPRVEEVLRRQPTAARRLWQALNDIAARDLLQAGRVYGGGLFKLEPKEMANVPAAGVIRSLGLTLTRPTKLVDPLITA